MRLSDFILLHKEEKKLILLHQSTLIAKRISGNCIIFLFQLDKFYVEMLCNVSDKKVEEYRVFEGTTHLQPYLDRISIAGVFNNNAEENGE